MNELLPCPFCGGEAKTEEEFTSFNVVRCDDCATVTDTYDTIAEAIAAWNRRTAPDTTEMARLQRRLDAEFDVLFGKKEPLGQVPTSLAVE